MPLKFASRIIQEFSENAEFDATSYQSAIVSTTTLPCNIFLLFDFEECRDLDGSSTLNVIGNGTILSQCHCLSLEQFKRLLII